jgi:hypothetical protein
MAVPRLNLVSPRLYAPVDRTLVLRAQRLGADDPGSVLAVDGSEGEDECDATRREQCGEYAVQVS